ncbi:MAG: alcohol dehydrogenase catalytic domain-containing protein, partial [Vicinamibacteria bacterium]
MTAVEITTPGGPEVLLPCARPVPRPGRDEVLIRVAAAGVNRPDILQRQGKYAPPPGASDIPGLEIAGRVIAVGEGAGGWHEGDAVTALVA